MAPLSCSMFTVALIHVIFALEPKLTKQPLSGKFLYLVTGRRDMANHRLALTSWAYKGHVTLLSTYYWPKPVT